MAFVNEMAAADWARSYDVLAATFGSAPTEEKTSAVCTVAQALGVLCPDAFSPADTQREFMNLLVVPNSRYVAPYESAYRDGPIMPGRDGNPRRRTGLLMGKSTLAVRQAFLAAGVLPERDLPDHIANELRLVSHLWHVEARGNSEQAFAAARQRRLFIAEHLLCWIGELRDRIAQNSVTGFYRAAVVAAEALLHAELASVPTLSEEITQEECPQPG